MATDPRRLLVNQLFMLLKTAQIHVPGNRAFQHPLEQFHHLLEAVVAEEGALALESVDVGLYLNETKIRSDISTFGTFRYLDDLFAQKEIGGLRFLQTPPLHELTEVVLVLAKGAVKGAEALNEHLASRNFTSVEMIPRKARKSVSRDQVTRTASAAVQKRKAMKNYVKAIDIIKDAPHKPVALQAMDARKAKRVVYNLVDICMDEGFSFLGLSSIKNYDEYTYNHSVNVCIICIAFGKNLGLSKRQIGELGMAGLYHDFGKTRIPPDILNKPGRFSDEEWTLMKAHPLLAIRELLAMKGGLDDVDIKKMIAAFEHHRNYDCSGYPQTGVTKQLNFYSRVVSIADSYDAMTTNRVYQRGMLPTVALKILMDHAGTKYDPLLVKAFVHTVGVYPVGALVELSNGALGIVTGVPEDPDKMEYPVVQMVVDERKHKLPDGPTVDLLATQSTTAPLSVVNLVRPEDYQVNVAHTLFGDALKE
jgi:HD-GYP domain-containing protein (c-di-GMP phosphodiesterase class II)